MHTSASACHACAILPRLVALSAFVAASVIKWSDCLAGLFGMDRCMNAWQRWLSQASLALVVLIGVLALSGCELQGFGEVDDDTDTNPGEDNAVVLGGIEFDNRVSDEVSTSAYYGDDIADGFYDGWGSYEGFRGEITWTRRVINNSTTGNRNLPVRELRIVFTDDNDRTWRDYTQILARSSDAGVYLLESSEEFTGVEQNYLSQPRLVAERVDATAAGETFTDGLEYRWRSESTDTPSPNGSFSNTRRLSPLATNGNRIPRQRPHRSLGRRELLR